MPAPAKILHLGLQRLKNVLNGPFSRVFGMNSISFRCSQAVSEKTGLLKKKIHKFYRVQSKVMTIFLSSFWKKNLKKNFVIKKIFFLKVVISFLNMARKKSFFFENFFGPDFDPNSENVTLFSMLEF